MNAPILYTAVGDSLTLGEGAFFAPGFEKQYAMLSEKALKRPIQINVFAKSGATSGEILKIIGTNRTRESLYHSQIITITAGGDDLIQAGEHFEKSKDPYLFLEALQGYSVNLSYMLREIASIKGSCTKPYIIRFVGLYNPLPKVPRSDSIISMFDSAMERFTNPFIRVAHIHYLFKQYGRSVISPDGIHPNSKGYQLIAETLYRTGYFPL